MKTKAMILAGCFSLSAHVTAQEQGIWYSWSGPGTQANYAIDVDGDTALTIVCKDTEPVSMFATIKGKEYGSGEQDFRLMVDGSEYLKPPYRLGRVRISTLHNETEKISLLNSNTYKGAFLCLVTYSHLP
ncbi:hypothetical protein [Aeromonas sp. D3]|uniref:hypothetical protein n=1 Tax=Aeromonas sp. D3 TaxID=2990474 RepID=UPI0022E0A04E|nr:hypothetical protein [Aeromonas sp. D3]